MEDVCSALLVVHGILHLILFYAYSLISQRKVVCGGVIIITVGIITVGACRAQIGGGSEGKPVWVLSNRTFQG